MFSLSSFPRCILHVDGDGFFASCEQAMRPELQGKPVVTGLERGIITSASKEAKALGISRDMRPWDAKKLCPSLIFTQSDYSSYELFSYRMASIVRKYTPDVEHYSIDECFADLTGLRSEHNNSYEELARRIKDEIQAGLGITVSVGVSTTKTLAKVASKWQKPNGFTMIPGKDIELFLAKLPVGHVWGIGRQTMLRLNKRGIRTALDFAKMPERIVRTELEKPLIECWQELRGNFVHRLRVTNDEPPKSLAKTHTFSPTTSFKTIEQELLKNIEHAFWKLRRGGLGAGRASIMVKSQDFHYASEELIFPRRTAYESDVLTHARAALARMIQPNTEYRTTGITLSDLASLDAVQSNLFEPPEKSLKLETLFKSIDALRRRYRKPLVRIGEVRGQVFDRHAIGSLKPGILLPVSAHEYRESRLAFL